jgi:hypothetical protein
MKTIHERRENEQGTRNFDGGLGRPGFDYGQLATQFYLVRVRRDLPGLFAFCHCGAILDYGIYTSVKDSRG